MDPSLGLSCPGIPWEAPCAASGTIQGTKAHPSIDLSSVGQEGHWLRCWEGKAGPV